MWVVGERQRGSASEGSVLCSCLTFWLPPFFVPLSLSLHFQIPFSTGFASADWHPFPSLFSITHATSSSFFPPSSFLDTILSPYSLTHSLLLTTASSHSSSFIQPNRTKSINSSKKPFLHPSSLSCPILDGHTSLHTHARTTHSTFHGQATFKSRPDWRWWCRQGTNIFKQSHAIHSKQELVAM